METGTEPKWSIIKETDQAAAPGVVEQQTAPAPVEVAPAVTTEPPPPPVTIDLPAPPSPAAAIAPAETPAPFFSEPAPVTPVQVDPYEALGLSKEDPNTRRLLDALKAGDLENYLRVATTDYDKMTDEQIIKMDLRNTYPLLPEDKLNVLFNRKLDKDYNIGDADPDAETQGRILMEAQAQSIRAGLKAKQAEYKIPEAPKAPATVDNSAQIAQEVEKFKNYFSNHPVVKQFETNRTLRLGEGDNGMNYEVDRSVDLQKQTTDHNAFYAKFWDEKKGNLDVERWAKTVAYSENPAQFEQRLIDHGIALGRKTEVDLLKNPKPADPGVAPASNQGWVITGRS